MYVKTILFSMSCLMASAALVPEANAGKATGTLKVQVNILESCKLTSGDSSFIDFGNVGRINSQTASTSDSTGITVNCTKDIPYKVGLGAGLNPRDSTDTPTLSMKSEKGEFIRYMLINGNGKNEILWGEGDAALSGTGNGEEQKYKVKAKLIYDGNTPSSGLYTDTVKVSLTY